MSRGLVRIERYRGRLGNQLAQYCFARRLAFELDFALSVPEIHGFSRAVSFGSYSATAGSVGSDFQLRQEVKTAHEVDLPGLLADRRPRIIDLNGIFLRHEYFAPYKADIKHDWLFSGVLTPIGPDDLTIHIRSGDVYRQPGYLGRQSTEYHTLPFSFYSAIIQEKRWRQIRVVTEDASDPMVRKLANRFGVAVVSGHANDDFNLVRASGVIVLSVSSFSWWAAWLSDAHRIYYPLAGLYDPRRAAARPYPWRHDLSVPDDERYIAVEPALLFEDWGGTQAERLRLLES
jgi:hypothetical protein